MAFTCARLPEALARRRQHERSEKQHDRDETGCDKAMHARLRGVPGAAEQVADAQSSDTPRDIRVSRALKSGQAPNPFFSGPMNLSNGRLLCCMARKCSFGLGPPIL